MKQPKPTDALSRVSGYVRGAPYDGEHGPAVIVGERDLRALLALARAAVRWKQRVDTLEDAGHLHEWLVPLARAADRVSRKTKS